MKYVPVEDPMQALKQKAKEGGMIGSDDAREEAEAEQVILTPESVAAADSRKGDVFKKNESGKQDSRRTQDKHRSGKAGAEVKINPLTGAGGRF